MQPPASGAMGHVRATDGSHTEGMPKEFLQGTTLDMDHHQLHCSLNSLQSQPDPILPVRLGDTGGVWELQPSPEPSSLSPSCLTLLHHCVIPVVLLLQTTLTSPEFFSKKGRCTNSDLI